MTKRDTAINLAKFAGYHNDSTTFTQLIIEARVNRQTMNEAFMLGKQARASGMKCHCRDCANTPQAATNPIALANA